MIPPTVCCVLESAVGVEERIEKIMRDILWLGAADSWGVGVGVGRFDRSTAEGLEGSVQLMYLAHCFSFLVMFTVLLSYVKNYGYDSDYESDDNTGAGLSGNL